MKKLITLFIAVVSCLVALAQGESRENAIPVTSATQAELLGVAEANTTTWFVIHPDAFAQNDLLTVTISGDNYGDIAFLPTEGEGYSLIVTGGSTTVKHLWQESQGDLYVAISQDGPGGQVGFAFSQAKAGEVRQIALEAHDGLNTVPQDAATEVWYRYTSQTQQLILLDAPTLLSNLLNEQGRIVYLRSNAGEGFRLAPGETVWFQLMAAGETTFSITLADVPVGHYADYPLDITAMGQFQVDIPYDPNATTDGAAQSERYWLYHARQSGLLMWGTDDSQWTAGSWGASIIDQTTGKRLGTPLTEVVAGMLTYTITVEAGHDYLIAQTIGHGKARQANVYVVLNAGQQGDTRDNPIPLTLGETADLGRVASTTRYYAFTAPQDGTYTATLHAGGQVRATTPQDGSWNIGRDYSIQDRQMHIDGNIPLRAGETLLLEVSLTSNIDIHVGGDADVPNYSILITLNGQEEQQPGDAPAGADMAHAIPAVQGEAYAVLLSSDEAYRPCYYAIQVPAGQALMVQTRHPEAVSSPGCISFTLDDIHWNLPLQTTLVEGTTAKRYIGRDYLLPADATARTVYLYVEGVSFLYEGMTWSYTLQSDLPDDPGTPTDPDALQAPSATTAAPLYNLHGQRLTNAPRKGLYIQGGRKIVK